MYKTGNGMNVFDYDPKQIMKLEKGLFKVVFIHKN